MSLPRITDYEILEKLGEGSYAKVYKCRYKRSPSSYHAIKCVEMSRLHKNSRDNLVTEIRLLRSLNHKHIVTLQDFFWDDKNIYIVLEYCNMGNLSTFLRSKKTLPEPTCQYFLRQLAAAMQYLRSNDVCHFDLKPENLLLTKNPNITLKVADFGFAQNLRMGEINIQPKGSPLYMAPEILRKKQFDAKADLWSIGVILYECLFGKAPYSSKTMEELLSRLRNAEQIMIPSSTRISKECNDLLCSLLEHNPAKRIEFEDFFSHPFIDLKTFPTEKTLQKAVDLITEACEYDNKQNYKAAYYLYCEALKYFVPLLTEEQDEKKRVALRNRTLSYAKRAEEIKIMLPKGNNTNSTQYKPLNACNSQQPSSSTQANRITHILEPDVRFKQLYAMSNSSPQLKSALDIGRQAELYMYEQKIQTSLESYTSALGMLIPFVTNEPKGERRTLILKQTEAWIKEAESIKSILSVKEMGDDQKLSSVRSCSIQ